MARPPASRGKAARNPDFVIPILQPWADRAPQGLRIAIVLLFACAVTPVLLWLHPVGDYFVETDFYGGYAPGVRAFWAGGLDPARYGVVGPIYEVVLALLSLTRLDLFRLAQFLSLAASALTILVASAWIERRFGRAAGWISALLMVTNPTVVRYSMTASTDALFVLLLTASFVLMFPAVAWRRRLLLAGLVAGLATLTRYTGIVLVPLGLLVPLWPGRANLWSGQRARAVATFALGVTLVFGPWWAFTATRAAPLTLRFYHNLAYEVYARSRGVTWDEYQFSLQKEFPTLASVFTRDPGAVAARVAANASEHIGQASKDLWLWPLAALAALGLALWLARLAPGAGPLVAYGGLLYVSLVPVFYAKRYHLPLVAVAAGLAAIALTSVRARLVRSRGAALLAALALACGLGAAGYAARETVRDSQANATQVPLDLPAMGAALRRDWKGPGHARLIARKPNLSYYANADPVPFVQLDSLETLARYARDQRADYLYISWPEALMRPGFAFLLVPEFAPPGLELLLAGSEGHSALYRIHSDFGGTMPAWYPAEWEVRAAEGMTRVAPDSPEYWRLAGEGRHLRKDYVGARAAYGYALQLHPGWGRAYFGLGDLDADQGDFAAARVSFESALRAGEDAPKLLRNLGVVYARTGDYMRAEDMITRYLAATHDPECVPLLGRIREQRAAAASAGTPH